jgi:hypothetical protein
MREASRIVLDGFELRTDTALRQVMAQLDQAEANTLDTLILLILLILLRVRPGTSSRIA